MESNYEKQIQMARELFMKYDQRAMIEKFDLKHDGEYLYLQLLDKEYRISRKSGEVQRIGQDKIFRPCHDFDAVMTLYDVLGYSEETPVLAREWCQLHALQVTMSSPNTDTFTQRYADEFSGKVERLWEICRQIGGTKPDISAGADIWWQFEVFPFFPVQFRYWDKDEEFPAQIRLLWDRNSLKFMHFETLYYVIGYLMRRLQRLLHAAQ